MATRPPETKRQRYDRLWSYLLNELNSSWRPHWQEINDYVSPRRVRWNNSTDRNRGERRNQKIIDAHGSLALRTATAGLMAGVTSPARPWMRLTTPDPDLAEFGPVKEWLYTVTRRMLDVFARSNFYNTLGPFYRDMLAFGTAAELLLEDGTDVLRGYGFPLGSYVIATDDTGRVDTILREFTMTVRQIVRRYGQRDDRTGAARWDNISHHVRQLWDGGHYENPIEVVHVITPNADYDPRRLSAAYKRWASCYFEKASREYIATDREKFLRESGFDRFPALVGRWDLASHDDVYGWPCPGMDALGDIKSLQLLQKRKAQAIEKAYNPPLTGPASLRTTRVSSLPGDITYEDVREGQKGLRAIYDVKPDIQGLLLDIDDHHQRISRAFFEDLFLLLTLRRDDDPQKTAREVAELHEEKLIMLGPVLDRLDNEVLGPAIDLTFDIMRRFPDRELIPAPPEEIAGVDLRVEYISVLAQAQKLIGVGAIERFWTNVRMIADIRPDAVDKVDTDQMIDELGDEIGVPPRILVPDDKVVAIRDARAQAQARAEKLAVLAQAAATGKTLADTDTGGKNALTDLVAAAGGNA
ncbi:MAG TPA: portal protein [Burkholderiaceae bacterium]|nr:portal protein [Burkholderiaceae bacterium]